MEYSQEGYIRHKEARAKQIREKHPRWKGRIHRSGYWYLYMPEHPQSGKQGYIAEHRVVMEKKIGRALLPEEAVHHIDHNKQNNHPDNLALYATHGQHTLAHPEVVQLLKTVNVGKRRSPDTEFKKDQKPWNAGLVLSDTTKICKVAECERSAWYKNGGKKGYCSKHIQVLRRGQKL